MPKTIRLNATHYFIIKIPNKRELQQIASNHSCDTNFKDLTIDNKIEQNKAQYNLDRQTAKISALLSENVSIYEFLMGKVVLPEKDLLEKAATMKRFEYSPLGKELKK